MKNIKQTLYATVAGALAFAPLMVGAASPVSSGFTPDKAADSTSGLSQTPVYTIIMNVMNWLLGIVGVLAVIAFVISGILYLTAAGDEEQIEKAKATMMYAIIGLVIALIGLIVVNAIGGLTGTTTTNSY